jgi:hypothetical protein
MKSYSATAWLLLTMLFIASCAGGGGKRSEFSDYPAETSTALLMDEGLASVIDIQDQSLSRDENGVVLAETLISNKTPSEVEIEVRSLFKDQMGLTKEASPWKKVTLGPRGRHIYVAPTLNQYAVRFIVQIRLDRSSGSQE